MRRFEQSDGPFEVAIPPSDDRDCSLRFVCTDRFEPADQFALDGLDILSDDGFDLCRSSLVARLQFDAKIHVLAAFIVVLDERKARIEYALMRAIIGVERDDLHGRPALLQEEEVLHGSALEAVDGLLLIADDEDIGGL